MRGGKYKISARGLAFFSYSVILFIYCFIYLSILLFPFQESLKTLKSKKIILTILSKELK